MLDDRALTERVANIGALLAEIEAIPDQVLRAKATQIIQGLLLLYGEGLARMVAIICEQGADHLLEVLIKDELIAHLLLLHDLHPVDVETRVLQALDEVRPYLQSHGGDVELIGIDNGIARVRLQGSCHGCPSSTITIKLAIEEAIQKAAPDLDGIEAEGVSEPRPAGFVPVGDLLANTGRKPISLAPAQQTSHSLSAPSIVGSGTSELEKSQSDVTLPDIHVPRTGWIVLDTMPSLTDRDMQAMDIAGTPVLILKLDGTLYAYHDYCPGCNENGAQQALLSQKSMLEVRSADESLTLTCSVCGHQYDVRRAGRCLGKPELHLQPIPLLVQDGTIRLALSTSMTNDKGEIGGTA